MKITLFRKNCIGCNVCVEHSPDHWIMSPADGKVVLKNSTQKGDYFIKNISIEQLEENKLAEKNCPVKIIQVHK